MQHRRSSWHATGQAQSWTQNQTSLAQGQIEGVDVYCKGASNCPIQIFSTAHLFKAVSRLHEKIF